DRVDTLALEGIGILDEARQVLGAAGWRESPRHREQHNLLAFEDFVGRGLLGPFRRAHHQLHGRYLVADLDRHWILAPLWLASPRLLASQAPGVTPPPMSACTGAPAGPDSQSWSRCPNRRTGRRLRISSLATC